MMEIYKNCHWRVTFFCIFPLQFNCVTFIQYINQTYGEIFAVYLRLGFPSFSHFMHWCKSHRLDTLIDKWSDLRKFIAITPIRPVNWLGPNDAIWRQISGLPLAQIMACCLTAPSHYLNQCWLIICKVEWHSSKASSQDIPQPSINEIIWKIKYLKYHSIFPGANELTHCSHCWPSKTNVIELCNSKPFHIHTNYIQTCSDISWTNDDQKSLSHMAKLCHN